MALILLEVLVVGVIYKFDYLQLAVQVTLFISDVNDEVPEFVNLRYKESIYEVLVIDIMGHSALHHLHNLLFYSLTGIFPS